MAENDGKLPQPPRYEYLNKRNKPFPWGPNSLFFNPRVSLYPGPATTPADTVLQTQRDMSIED
jgi:hypothetical protein